MKTELGSRAGARGWLPLVLREIGQRRTLGSAGLCVVLFGLLPSWWAFGDRNSHLLEFPTALFVYLHRTNPMILVFPLVATLPYILGFAGEVSNRFLTYARFRSGIRPLLRVRLAANAAVTFTVFFLIGLIPQFFVVWGPVTQYRPESADLFDEAAIRAAEASFTTLSQWVDHGPWVFPVAYAGWLGLNAVLYSSMALCTVVLIRNRALGIASVWIATILVIFLMAVLGLEAYSPALYSAFNLTQLPVTNLLVPLSMVGGATVVLVCATLWLAPRIARLQ